MDFDEYEYLEKTVENPEQQNANDKDGALKSEKKEQDRSLKHRNDGDCDLFHHSKRSKSEDDSHGRNRHRERGSSRYRSRSRDREKVDKYRDRHRSSRDRDRERGREESNGKGRHRERGKDRDMAHERDHGGQEHYPDRERDGDCDRHRDRRRRSHSEKHREDTEKSWDKEYREKGRDRESRSNKEKKDVAEPVGDPERDQRTVFAYQIALKADERDVFEFFSRAGKVRDVRLIMDRNSRRSKGVGYVEFYDALSVPMAIALSGQPLLGQPVMVKPSEAEKNMAQSTSSTVAAAQASTYSGGGRRIYVGNLHYNMTEEQLQQVFEPFGTVELIQLPLDDAGHCKGFGFIQFAQLDEAQAALNLNGQLDIAGQTIKVSPVTDNIGAQDAGKNTGDLDDDEGGSLHLNAQSRALLMAKLDRGGAATSVGGYLGATIVSNGGLPSAPAFGIQPSIPPLIPSIPPLGGLSSPGLPLPLTNTIGVPSECLLLKNIFDPNAELEPDFDQDIKEDVQDECAKFGSLKHIQVEKHGVGFVYLRFENTQSAASAQRALHGRWFAGKMITATFMLPQKYEAKFPDVKWEAAS